METAPNGLSSREQNVLLSMVHGMWQNRSLSLIVAFKIPELLCNTQEPISIEDIATKTGCTSSKQLYTIMRVLAQWGVGKELGDKRFTKNQSMEMLRRDKGPSLGDVLAYFCCDEHFTAMRSLAKCVRQDRPAFLLEHGMTHMDYMNEFQERPYEKEKMFEGLSAAAHLVGSDERRTELAKTYQRAMECMTKLETFPDAQGVKNTMYTVFPWSTCNKLVHVAGGTGPFLASILKEPGCEHIQGYVVEFPHVVDKARENFQRLGIPEHRLQFIKHDITNPFQSDFKLGADTIMLNKFIGMFWEDKERIAKSLQNCRSLFSEEGGRLLIIEVCSPDAGDTEHNVGVNGIQHGFYSIHWINIWGGRFRSKSEWIELLKGIGHTSGFQLSQVYDTFVGGYTIFELSVLP